MPESIGNRERALFELAERLFFTVRKDRGRYSFRRDVDVPERVARDGLTLDEAEELLRTWRLSGEHGG